MSSYGRGGIRGLNRHDPVRTRHLSDPPCALAVTGFRLANSGGLYGVTADRLGVHPLTSARNRRLVEICELIRTNDGNVVEALASGISAALAAAREAGMPDLELYGCGRAIEHDHPFDTG